MTDTPQAGGAPRPAAPAVLALVADLVFASRIRGTAATLGMDVQVVRGADELLARARAAPPRLVLVDLEARAADPAGTIARLRATPGGADIPIVAFGAHVNRDAIEAARAAGATRVLARSAFVRELPGLLADPPGA
jgi:CheY-like chemotaxis protein